MASVITKGTVVSFGNTPQAVGDSFTNTGLTEGGGTVILDVMGNDLGGAAKSLYSLDDGTSLGGIRPTDLLTKDGVGVIQYSAMGAEISITADGKVAYNLTSAVSDSLQHLAEGDSVTDTFTYAIKLGNGTLAWATATVTIAGANDGPVAVADVNSTSEDSVVTGSVATNDSDVDDGAVLTYSLAGDVAGLTLNADGSYSFDAGDVAYQHLASGATVDVTANYTVTDEFGASANSTLTITVTGTNDAPVAAADVNSGSEDSVITGSVATNDGDVDDGAVLTYSLDGDVAGLTLNADGSYSFDAGNAAYQSLNDGDQLPVVASYTVTDEFGATSNSTLTITVDGVTDIVAPPPATEYDFTFDVHTETTPGTTVSFDFDQPGLDQSNIVHLYDEFLKSLGTDGADANTTVDVVNNNGSQTTAPTVEGFDGTFSSPKISEPVQFPNGAVKVRYFSESATTADTSEEIVTSPDGVVVISGFAEGSDTLDFSGLTAQQFDDHMLVNTAQDWTGDSIADTQLTLDTDPSFEIVLSGVQIDKATLAGEITFS
ncbi:MAG: hypothetical protein EPO55_24050 [Reyranella sp.]|uniref:VCBS domain-containing protein n=1 Tax=Reyranella sp. TaxID=1929291 RepID=UPI0012220F66|nr:VCBS domain-containing protein [Reyranella sp.]TAJ35851.1 MAG: hypothetical protein EPO55_24050 [Reyranella sp.]